MSYGDETEARFGKDGPSHTGNILLAQVLASRWKQGADLCLRLWQTEGLIPFPRRIRRPPIRN